MAPNTGFSFVEIPAKAEEPMLQHYFEQAVTERTDYLFLRHLKSLLGHAPVTTGRDSRRALFNGIVEADGSGCFGDEKDLLARNIAKIDDSYLELLLTLTSVETIVFRVADYDSGTRGVSLVHGGDPSAAVENRSAEQGLNIRAAALCDACGFPPKVIYGKCFILGTAAYKEEHDIKATWRRANITVEDCRSDSPWVVEVRTDRERSGAMRDDSVDWFKSLPEDDGKEAACAGGETATYRWYQSDDEVDISFFPRPFKECRASRRDITVRIQSRKLFVRLRGRVLLDIDLNTGVAPTGSSWTYSQDSHDLHITLEKAVPGVVWCDLQCPRQKQHQQEQQKQKHRLQQPEQRQQRLQLPLLRIGEEVATPRRQSTAKGHCAREVQQVSLLDTGSSSGLVNKRPRRGAWFLLLMVVLGVCCFFNKVSWPLRGGLRGSSALPRLPFEGHVALVGQGGALTRS